MQTSHRLRDRHADAGTKRGVLAAILLLPLNLGVFHAAPNAPRLNVAGKLTPCQVAGVDEEVRCGRYEAYVYGTTAAMVYLRQHPARVRTVALQGVIPFDVPMWLEVPRSSQQALEHVFAACARQPGCHGAFPELENEFGSLLKRLAEKPVTLKVSQSDTGHELEVTIDDEILRGFVSPLQFSASRIHDLPLLVHLAHQGDSQPLATRLAVRGESGIPKGVYLSIVCSEIIPQFEPSALSAAAAGTFLGTAPSII